MNRLSILLAFILIVSAGVCSLLTGSAHAQVDARALPEAEQQRRQQQFEAEIRQRQAAEDAFIADFLRQPPQERVRLWRNNLTTSFYYRIDALMIARGVDTAPYLAEIVRGAKTYARLFALSLLCDMDRFVPAEQLPIRELGEYSEKLADGRRDLFMVVDGRRIGREAYATVKWAAEQTQDRDLRFHARQYAGLLDQELRNLPLSEQIKQWREAVAESRGDYGVLSDHGILHSHLNETLVEEAPESLPPLIDLLENDRNGYIREAAIDVIWWVDRYRMRLRRSEIGRKAIEAVHQALERGGLKPVYKKRQSREELWKQISSEVFEDGPTPEGGFNWAFYAFCVEKLYGAKTTVPGTRGQHPRPDPLPEWRRFLTYLTEVDPLFPSWEYTHVGVAFSEILHPRFHQKMARYYEQWQRFKAGEPPKQLSRVVFPVKRRPSDLALFNIHLRESRCE